MPRKFDVERLAVRSLSEVAELLAQDEGRVLSRERIRQIQNSGLWKIETALRTQGIGLLDLAAEPGLAGDQFRESDRRDDW